MKGRAVATGTQRVDQLRHQRRQKENLISCLFALLVEWLAPTADTDLTSGRRKYLVSLLVGRCDSRRASLKLLLIIKIERDDSGREGECSVRDCQSCQSSLGTSGAPAVIRTVSFSLFLFVACSMIEDIILFYSSFSFL